jgi:hypothetical protein
MCAGGRAGGRASERACVCISEFFLVLFLLFSKPYLSTIITQVRRVGYGFMINVDIAWVLRALQSLACPAPHVSTHATEVRISCKGLPLVRGPLRSCKRPINLLDLRSVEHFLNSCPPRTPPSFRRIELHPGTGAVLSRTAAVRRGRANAPVPVFALQLPGRRP